MTFSSESNSFTAKPSLLFKVVLSYYQNSFPLSTQTGLTSPAAIFIMVAEIFEGMAKDAPVWNIFSLCCKRDPANFAPDAPGLWPSAASCAGRRSLFRPGSTVLSHSHPGHALCERLHRRIHHGLSAQRHGVCHPGGGGELPLGFFFWCRGGCPTLPTLPPTVHGLCHHQHGSPGHSASSSISSASPSWPSTPSSWPSPRPWSTP